MALSPQRSPGHIVSPTRYERLELIGTGSFGEVYRGWDREDGLEVAIKVIDLENVEDDITEIHKEVAMLAQCHSSNITEYYASVMLPGTTELLIVMELMAGSVSDLLDKEGSALEERSIAYILREVLKALVYLHAQHRIHRDVKSANVLLSAHGEVKLSDFGVSGQLSKTVAFKRKTFVGSPFWMAPEVIRANTKDDGYTETADIWSLGITAYEMAAGRPPHADLHPMRALFLIPAENAPRLDGPFSQEFKSFVAQCLQKDPKLRPSAKTLLHHPFLSGPHDSGKLAELIQVHADTKRTSNRTSGKTQTPVRQPASKWDFDTIGRATIRAPNNLKGTLKSHQINSFTIRDTTWGSTFAQRQLQSWDENSSAGSRGLLADDIASLSDGGPLESLSPLQSPPIGSANLDEIPYKLPPGGSQPLENQASLETIPEERSSGKNLAAASQGLAASRQAETGAYGSQGRPQGGTVKAPEATEISPGGTILGIGRPSNWLSGLWKGQRNEIRSDPSDGSQAVPSQAAEPGGTVQISATLSDPDFSNSGTVRYGGTVQASTALPDSGTVRLNTGNAPADVQGNSGEAQKPHSGKQAFARAAQNRVLSAMLPAEKNVDSPKLSLELRELLFGPLETSDSTKSEPPLSKSTLKILGILRDQKGSSSLSPMQPTPDPGYEQSPSGNEQDLGSLGNFLMARWKSSALLKAHAVSTLP